MKSILTLLGIILLAACGILFLSHQDTTARANAAYRKLAPVSASFSRFRSDKQHIVSIYWRLHFTGKRPKMPENYAYWSLRPFRRVTLAAK